MINNIKLFLLIMLFSIGFTSCEKDNQFKPSVSENSLNLQTVHPKDVAEAFKAFKAANLNKSGQSSWITPYFQYNDSIGIDNSNAHITVTPVVTTVSNAYSRLFSLEINGEVESVLYHMIPDSISTSNSFWGKVLITDLSGDLLSAFDVEDNLYINYYDIKNHSEKYNIFNKGNKNLNKNNNNGSCPDNCDHWHEELDEVTVTEPPNDGLSAGITIIFVPELFPDNSDGGASSIPDSTPSEPTAPAGNTNQDGCPPGLIKDENGNCVEPPEDCPDENMIQNDDGDCDCKSGYVEDKDGNCKKIPCPGNPVSNIKIASQSKSGILGGMYGCNRYGGNCTGTDGRNKHHAGIDLENPYGAPVFAMFDGTVYNTPFEQDAGYMVQIQSTLPTGQTVITTYFHLQKDNRITMSTNPLTNVVAGQIIGYQGDSGNLRSAINGGYTDSHVHIETRLHDGSSSWNFDNNFNLVDPRNYLETDIDNNGVVTDDCN